MNLYGLKPPVVGYGSSGMAEKWREFRERLAALRSSSGSQAVIRARRKALINPPLYVDPGERTKRRLKNRARKESPRTAIR